MNVAGKAVSGSDDIVAAVGVENEIFGRADIQREGSRTDPIEADAVAIGGDREGLGTVAAIHFGGVDAIAALEQITAVTGIPDHAVVAGAAEQLVIPGTADQHIIAEASEQQIVAPLAVEGVVTGTAKKLIVTRTAGQHVVAGAAGQ